MTEKPHTADLATRYRYRQEGAELERERFLNRLQDKYDETLDLEGIALGKERLDLLIELMDEIKGEHNVAERAHPLTSPNGDNE
jgi:hypothetical protein